MTPRVLVERTSTVISGAIFFRLSCPVAKTAKSAFSVTGRPSLSSMVISKPPSARFLTRSTFASFRITPGSRLSIYAATSAIPFFGTRTGVSP